MKIKKFGRSPRYRLFIPHRLFNGAKRGDRKLCGFFINTPQGQWVVWW